MKRFAVSVLTISVFFVGLGSLAEHVGAKFKSDEKALDIVRKARTAIGGDAALAEVRSLVIVGRTVNAIKVGDAQRSEPGETEIALQLPDKLSRVVKIGKDDGTGEKIISKHHDVVLIGKGEGEKMVLSGGENGEFTTSDDKKIVIKERVAGNADLKVKGGKKVIVRQIDGGNGETDVLKVRTPNAADEKHVTFTRAGHTGPRHNELLRLTLALLLTAPDGIEVNYTFAGESDIDGTAVNIINAEFGGSNYKLFISKSNNLPVAMSYVGLPMPAVVKFTGKAPASADEKRDHVVFTKKIDGEAAAPVENLVKFADYRSTGSIQLPYKWTTSVGGSVRETFDVTSFEINPANIAERFQNQKVMVRMKKPDGQ